MKKIKPIHLGLALMLAVGIAGIGANALHAATGTNSNPMSSLVAAIAEKFNLNQADVQQVFDAEHAKEEANREAEYKTRIAADVTSGKLTQDQADKILAKNAELQSLKTNFEGKTEVEKQAAMKAEMDSLKTWSTDNNIPLQYLEFGFGHGGPHNHRGMGGPGRPNDNDEDDAPTAVTNAQ